MNKKWTRRSALGLIGSGAGLLTWGTGGFTEVQANRDVSIGNRPDPDGLVGFDDDDDNGGVSGCPGDKVDLFELSNNFGGDSMSVDSITITTASGGLSKGDINNVTPPSSPIGSTDTGTVTGKLDAGAGGSSGQVTFKIEVSQNDVSTTLDRTVDVTIKTEVIKAFTTTGSQNWNVPSDVANVDVLVVGGGGGGAANTNYSSAGGGGGGAGGVVFATDYAVSGGGTVSLDVGNGGAGKDANAPVTADDGGLSTFGQLEAKGGGGGNLTGGGGNKSANDGGSGGGGRQNPPGTATQLGTNSTVSNVGGIADFGNNGARNSTDNGGGGGGGAGEEPVDISGNDGGAGGDGVAEAIISGETYVFADIFGTQYGESNGSDVYFGGGGGGGGDGNGSGGGGGLGGGGDGASDLNSKIATDGIQNTGGGGGGGASGPPGEPGGDGGSGVILLNYCTSNPSPPSTEVQVNSTSSLDGGQANSFNFNHTMNSGSNQAVYVFLQLMDKSASKDAASVTYDGDSLTEIENFSGADIKVQVFRKLAPATGTNNVVVNLDGSSENKVGIGVIGFDNVNQSTPEDAILTNSGQGTSATISGISTEGGDLVVDVIGTDKSVNSPGSGQTEQWAAEAESGKQAKGSTKDDSGSVDLSWSFSNGKFSHVGFNINSV